MFRYFFSYFGTSVDGGLTFGNMPISSRKPIRSQDDVDRARAYIHHRRTDLADVVVLSWQKFEDDPESAEAPGGGRTDQDGPQA